MATNTNIEKIKLYIKDCVGKNFDIVAKRGRKKILLENCIIDSAYPSIFIVKTKNSRTGDLNSMSFSYIDILTKNVSFFPPLTIKNEKGA